MHKHPYSGVVDARTAQEYMLQTGDEDDDVGREEADEQ
jgi:hypothetical protein